MKPRKKYLTIKQGLEKAQHYCAYQERCHKEVKDKLYELGLHKTEVEEIMATLITSGFLNEERFAKTFAGSKFRQKKWGRIKIVRKLKEKHISEYCIASALKEIEESDYLETLKALLKKKADALEEKNEYVKKSKISKYLVQKGYEPDLVWSELKKQSY